MKDCRRAIKIRFRTRTENIFHFSFEGLKIFKKNLFLLERLFTSFFSVIEQNFCLYEKYFYFWDFQQENLHNKFDYIFTLADLLGSVPSPEGKKINFGS